MSGQIDEQDAKDIVRLVGEVAMMEASRNDRRKALMDGLAMMIRSKAWLWFTSAHTTAGEHPVHTIILRNGISDEQFSLMMKAAEVPDMARLTAPFFHQYSQTGSHTTRLRQQIVANIDFELSEVHPIWKKADIGPVILSAHPTSDGQVSMIGLYRHADEPLFTERESRIAHIILSEIPSLHDDISPSELNSSVIALTPRLRQVLNCQIQGYSRKEIAHHLDLSIHTVGDYIAELYKRFEVHSQADLLRKFLAGDGGDSPIRNS
tara:strand:- start:922 stop:1713 length:792 start_codon:yes stop_codon:yes gene_type:complete